jgi:hypothetical protein
MTPVILGIDPGQVSGWAVAVDTETVIASGTARTAADRREAVGHAWQLASDRGASVRVALECPPTFGGRLNTAIGLGLARGRWLEWLELQGYSAARVLKVTPDVWRRATHGVYRAQGADRKEREAAYKRAAVAFTSIAQPDAAEAACIALWAAGELGIGEAA